MIRIERVLAAKKMAEMARLGVFKTAENAARAHAAGLRDHSRRLSASSSPGDMKLNSRWQALAEASARAAEAKAEEIAQGAEQHRQDLMTAIGREAAMAKIIARNRKNARLKEARRAEDMPSTGG